MILVSVEDYCQSCLDFSPDVVKATRTDDKDVWTDTIIQCEYRKRCSGIKRYLEHQMKNKVEASG